MNRIKILSTIAIIVLLPMLIAYPYEALRWQLNISFLEPERWSRGSAWVDEGIAIPMHTRAVFFGVWFIPTLWGVCAYALGLRTLWLVRAGRVFDPVVARSVTWLGVLIVLSSVGSLAAGAVSPMIRSWHNAGGPLPLRFWYDSGNLGLMYSGLAFVFLGLVMAEAIRIARENEAFI